VLFDYQAIHEPLTVLETSLNRIVPRADRPLFLQPTVLSTTIGGGLDLDTERPIWRDTWLVQEPRGLTEFHGAQWQIIAAVALLNEGEEEIRSMLADELGIRLARDSGLTQRPEHLERLRTTRAAFRDRLVQANAMLQEARRLLEEARAALLNSRN
jgi:hypothetical protein